MLTSPIRLGINGFGRIGRCITRIANDDPRFEIVAINDLVEDIDNFVYLYNYDSTYGKATTMLARTEQTNTLQLSGKRIMFYGERDLSSVPWQQAGVQILIDASGITKNLEQAGELVNDKLVERVIVTHSPDAGVDRHIIMGVNEDQIDLDLDRLFSATICDANAIAHPLKVLDQTFGIQGGFVTTLHPWLSYQNLVDGPTEWQSSPGAYWKDYALGRSSINTLIPKTTTAVTALRHVMPKVEAQLSGLSFRTPTTIVSSADITVNLSRATSIKEIIALFERSFANSAYVKLNTEALVGIDFAREPFSAVIDLRWVELKQDQLLKVVVWYDNEWGYSSQTLALAHHLAR